MNNRAKYLEVNKEKNKRIELIRERIIRKRVNMEELQKLEELNNLLTSALSEYKKRGQDYAKAYKNYRILVAQELLRLRDSGIPVTICHDLARGKVEVENAKEQEIIA